jgi:hypothetical protein
MVRNIVGVVVGYIVIFAFVFLTFTVLYLILGTEGSFQARTYDVTVIWIVISFILGLVAAVLGGFICVLISKNQKAAFVLAGLVFVFGIAMAIPAINESTNDVHEMRKDDVSNMEAMQNAREPLLVVLLNLLIGAIGVFGGSKLKKESL